MNREQQFREAFRENSQRIFRICSHFFIDNDDKNDAYQETLIRIWENLPSFRGNARLSTWIYRVAINTCLSHIRSEKKRNNLIEPGIDPETLQVLQIPDDDQRIEEQKTSFLRQFMMNLSVADRTLVSLYLEDLSTREMAEITGISEANVRVRIHRIKDRIRNEWEEKQHGTG
jgi:RNA polymerase sigma-70 factor (ECF subfamily)